MNKNLIKKSKFLSLVLRHEPHVAGITLDAAGWTAVDELLAGCLKAGVSITSAELDEIIRTNEKQRFILSDDGRQIRANQGHSVEVELGYSPERPPDVLYHGTAIQFVDAIRTSGLSKRKRHDVHLSTSIDMTMAVGGRHGKPVLVTIDAAGMYRDGFEFFNTPNGVWLTDTVPAKYLTIDDKGGPQ